MTNLMVKANLNVSTKDNSRPKALVTLITKPSSPLRLAVALPWLTTSSMKTARIQLALVTKFPTPARLSATPETVARCLKDIPHDAKLWTTIGRMRGAVTSWLKRSTPERVVQVQALAGDMSLTHVEIGSGEFNAGGNPTISKHPIQGGVEILLVPSC